MFPFQLIFQIIQKKHNLKKDRICCQKLVKHYQQNQRKPIYHKVMLFPKNLNFPNLTTLFVMHAPLTYQFNEDLNQISLIYYLTTNNSNSHLF